MSFGFIFDFKVSSRKNDVSRVTTAAQVIKQQWFLDAINYTEPIDLFLVIGHNPVQGPESTFSTYIEAIRKLRPNIPIQIFGGHRHIRDFAVYDSRATGLASGIMISSLSGELSLTHKKVDTVRLWVGFQSQV
jgi:hypothetical protein